MGRNGISSEFSREVAGVADNVCRRFAIGFYRDYSLTKHSWRDFEWTDGSGTPGSAGGYANWEDSESPTSEDGDKCAYIVVCGLQRSQDDDEYSNGYWIARDNRELAAVCQLPA